MMVQDGLPPRERVRALVVIILGIGMAVLDGLGGLVALAVRHQCSRWP